MPQYKWQISRVASYHVSMELNVREDSFIMNNIHLNVTLVFEGCPRYHSMPADLKQKKKRRIIWKPNHPDTDARPFWTEPVSAAVCLGESFRNASHTASLAILLCEHWLPEGVSDFLIGLDASHQTRLLQRKKRPTQVSD